MLPLSNDIGLAPFHSLAGTTGAPTKLSAIKTDKRVQRCCHTKLSIKFLYVPTFSWLTNIRVLHKHFVYMQIRDYCMYACVCMYRFTSLCILALATGGAVFNYVICMIIAFTYAVDFLNPSTYHYSRRHDKQFWALVGLIYA